MIGIGGAVVHVGAPAARVRRVPVLRPAARGRADAGPRRPTARARPYATPAPAPEPQPARNPTPRGPRDRPARRTDPDRPAAPRPTGPYSPPGSSARSCARTPRSTRPTTASAASASCCATWRASTSSSCARAARRAIPRSRCLRTDQPTETRSACSSMWWVSCRPPPPAAQRPEEPAPQAAARLHREAVRVQQLPVLREAARPRPGHDGLGRGDRRPPPPRPRLTNECAKRPRNRAPVRHPRGMSADLVPGWPVAFRGSLAVAAGLVTRGDFAGRASCGSSPTSTSASATNRPT